MRNQIARIDHINFSVDNFHESVCWYKKVFNFELVEEGIRDDGNRWGILRNGDSMLAIGEWPEKSLLKGNEFHQMYHFGIYLENREEWERTMKENSLQTFYSSPIRYPHSTSWYVKDPTGYKIEVSIWKDNTVRF